MNLIRKQSESESVIRDVSYDIVHGEGRFELVDSSIGDINSVRFPYVSDTVKLNRKRLDHMLVHYSDWTDQECLQAQSEIVSNTEFNLFSTKNKGPKR